MKTTLYLVRHAEAEGNIARRFHGHTNGQITPNGKLQLERLREHMSKVLLNKIYASDLDRTMETARAVQGGRNIPLVCVPTLREINGGQWEGMLFDELETQYAQCYAHWSREPHLCVMPGGESIQQLHDRVVPAVLDIAAQHAGEPVAVVTHGTPIRVLGCYFRGLPLSKLNEVGWVDNASVTTVEFENGVPHIVSEGDCSYIGELSTLAKQNWWRGVGDLKTTDFPK